MKISFQTSNIGGVYFYAHFCNFDAQQGCQLGWKTREPLLIFFDTFGSPLQIDFQKCKAFVIFYGFSMIMGAFPNINFGHIFALHSTLKGLNDVFRGLLKSHFLSNHDISCWQSKVIKKPLISHIVKPKVDDDNGIFYQEKFSFKPNILR